MDIMQGMIILLRFTLFIMVILLICTAWIKAVDGVHAMYKGNKFTKCGEVIVKSDTTEDMGGVLYIQHSRTEIFYLYNCKELKDEKE